MKGAGYFTLGYHALYQNSYIPAKSIEYNKLTHIALAAVSTTATGTIIPANGAAVSLKVRKRNKRKRKKIKWRKKSLSHSRPSHCSLIMLLLSYHYHYHSFQWSCIFVKKKTYTYGLPIAASLLSFFLCTCSFLCL